MAFDKSNIGKRCYINMSEDPNIDVRDENKINLLE